VARSSGRRGLTAIHDRRPSRFTPRLIYKVLLHADRPFIDLVAEGDKVAARRSYKGTHRGELLGIPPTGKPVQIGGISIFRLAGGKITEHWEQIDGLALMQQLGVVPAPAQGAQQATPG
jgi:predicted SnoaL-like aldol condensation-catalyzing enzyme